MERTFEISGIKCDNCSYKDYSVKFEEYPSYINKPCPICSHNLLTQKDYDKCVKMYNIAEKLGKVSKVLRWINPFHYWRLVFGDKRKKVNMEIPWSKTNHLNNHEDII